MLLLDVTKERAVSAIEAMTRGRAPALDNPALAERITPGSFSTRRLNVTYVNTENGRITQHDAFLIEDRKLLLPVRTA